MNKKCSKDEHKKNNAISYCKECNIYMCNKCENYHSMLFEKHNKFSLDKDLKEIFTGLCQEENHNKELKYYCKEHNKLCCVACISKIKDKENGQHKDCSVYSIDEIKEGKKAKFVENIKYLENISQNIEKYINDSKQLYNKINEQKEKIKSEIQKVFTKIRNELNNREDKLIEEMDKIYDESFLKEEIIRDCEKLPNKIKNILEKYKSVDENWNDNTKLKSLINDSINIENYIKDINNIYENVKKVDIENCIIEFNIEEKDLNSFLIKIQNLGNIINKNEIVFDNQSTIINNQKSLNFVLKQIKINNNLKIDEVCNLKLLYRATKDGDNCKTYHQKTNNISNTLTIIKTKDGIIFGGYTHIKIPKSDYGMNYKDEKAFIFSLNLNKLYFPKQNFYSKHSNENYGPIFGTNEDCNYPIIIDGQNFFSKKSHSTCTKNSSYNNMEFDYELNKGNRNFEVKEIEVYQILFGKNN